MSRVRIIAALFLIAGVLAFAPAAFPSDTVKIVDVGLQGYYSPGNPALVRVLVDHADPQPATVELRIHIHVPTRMHIERLDTFTQIVKLGPNERRTVDVPVFLYRNGTMDLEELGEHGQVIAKDSIPVDWELGANLIALLCAEQKVCQEAQTQISFSGTSAEQALKGEDLRFVTVHDVPEEWWVYWPARAIVLAEPVDKMSPLQRAALEEFVRQRGTLVVIEEKVGDPGFLAPYRTPPSWGAPSVVGRGKVFWVPSLQSGELGGLYAGPQLLRAMNGWQVSSPTSDEMDWTRKRVATQFRFPTLTWLLIWLTAYILIAGMGNFIVLRWINRREWGWVTLPCLSLLFAFAMYFSSASNRPRDFRAEDITIHWMDDNSPVAAVERGERISAPYRQTLDFSVSGNVILGGDRNWTGDVYSENPFGFVTQDQLLNFWNVKTGPPLLVTLHMLQWSFRDLELFGIEQRPGTVHFDGPGHLRNNTGTSFRQALFVDRDTVYFFDGFAAGADMNLAEAKQEPLAHVSGNSMMRSVSSPTDLAEEDSNGTFVPWRLTTNAKSRFGEEFAANAKTLSETPFDLAELIRGWSSKGIHAFDSRSGIFFGLADEPDPPVSLSGIPFTRKGYSITIVSFERKP